MSNLFHLKTLEGTYFIHYNIPCTALGQKENGAKERLGTQVQAAAFESHI